MIYISNIFFFKKVKSIWPSLQSFDWCIKSSPYGPISFLCLWKSRNFFLQYHFIFYTTFSLYIYFSTSTTTTNHFQTKYSRSFCKLLAFRNTELIFKFSSWVAWKLELNIPIYLSTCSKNLVHYFIGNIS